MSYRILKTTNHVARKDYPCDVSLWITECDVMENVDEFGFSFADKRILVKIRQENFKILAGTKYQEQVGVQDGDFYCTKGRLDAIELCNKYDLWGDE